MTIEQFGKALAASGLMTADDVRAFWTALPAESRPKTADEFGARLVEKKLLTAFQIQRILAGQGGSLVMGDYVILAEIGAGGMGQVYKAKHRRMERIVALKVMSSAAMKDEAAVKRFQREVRAAAKLEHPNIVTAYDSGEAGNVKYLVMQFVDGGDLSSLVKSQGALPIEKAVDYVLQAARGLSFAHAEGVIHRDIKPANLLVDKKGVVKILDMGLARIESGDDGLTATEQVMGTVDYMSPEQAANTKGADGRADIYSLGCTLWYLLTGKKAYEGDTMIARLMAHRDAPLPSLVKTRDDAPWALEQALHKMLAKRPQDRYQSMDEVVAALEPFGGGGSSKGPMGSSIGGGAHQSAELAAFLQSVGTKPGASGTNLGATKTAMEPKSDATLAPEVTASFVKAEAETDPKSQLLPRGKPLPKPQPQPVRKKKPPVALIAGGVGVLVIALVAGIIVTIKTKDGEVVATVEAPTGSTVEVRPTAAAPKVPVAAPVVVPSTEELIKALESPEFVWSTPENLGPNVNTNDSDLGPSLGSDQLRLIFRGSGQTKKVFECRRNSIDEPFKTRTDVPTAADTGGHPFMSGNGLYLVYDSHESSVGKADIRLRRRDSPASPWKQEETLKEVNSAAEEFDPIITDDGLMLIFASDRPGGAGMLDLYIAQRKSIDAPFSTPQNLGRAINSSDNENAQQLLADGKTLVFSRGNKRMYTYQSASTGVMSAIELPNWPSNFQHPWLAPDCRTVYFHATLPGGLGKEDIWVSRLVPRGSLQTPSATQVATSPTTTGRDYALKFDGGQSAVNIPNLRRDEAGPFTLECWVRGISDGTMPVVRVNGRAPIQLHFHRREPHGAERNQFNLVARDSYGPAIDGDEWTHIAYVVNPNESRLFVNGKSVNVQAKPAPATMASAKHGDTWISSERLDPSVASTPLTGEVDELRVSKVARYTPAGFTPARRHEPDADTLALYHFDEGNGDWLADSSGRQMHGRITSATWTTGVSGVAGSTLAETTSVAGGWTSLFNGLDLLGWKAVGEKGWSVENGAIVGRASSPSGWLKSDQIYGDFEMEFEYRLTPESNSGVFLRAPAEGNVSGKDFHEIQLLDDTAAKFASIPAMAKTGSLYNKLAAQKSKVPGPNVWHKMSVSAFGERVRVRLNDEQILDGALPPGKQSEGHVGFQLYPHEVTLRNIRIRPLLPDGTPPDPAATREAAQEIDLLALIDPARDRATVPNYTKANNWTKIGGKLVFTTDGESGKIVAPVDLSNAQDFELTCDVRRTAGNRSFTMDFAPSAQKWSGLDVHIGSRIELKMQGNNRKEIAAWPASAVDGGRLALRIRKGSPAQPGSTGQPGSATISVNGVEVGRWEGDLSSTGGPAESHPQFPGTQNVGLFCYRSSFEISGYKLRVLEGEARPLVGNAANGFALEFDGETSYVELPISVSSLSAPLTLEAWIVDDRRQPSPPTRGQSVLALREGAKLIGLYRDDHSFGGFGSGALVTTETAPEQIKFRSQSIPTPMPLHVAWVLNEKGDTRVYVNGAEVQGTFSNLASSRFGPASVEPPKQAAALIGAFPLAAAERTAYFSGVVDEVRISKAARYRGGFTPARRLDTDADTIALYHFDEGSGDILRDSSGNGRDGKIVGAKWVPVNETSVSFRNALRLSGGGYVDLANDLVYDGGDVTFETWLIIDEPRWINTLLAVDHDSAGRRHALRLSVVGGRNVIEVSRPSEQLTMRFDDTLPVGRPAHLAAVWQGRDLRLYIDGKRVPSHPHSFTFAARSGKPYAWLGGMPAAESPTKVQQQSEATLLETRITSRARYDADFTPAAQLTPDADTVLLYKFDEGTGDVLHDSSGHGRQAKIVGAKWTKVAGVPDSAVHSAAAPANDYAIDFTGINGPTFPNANFDASKPFTMECTATPLSLPKDGDQWNSPLMNVGWPQVKLYSSPPRNKHVYSCILQHADKSLTTIELGPAYVNRPAQIAVCSDGREVRCFLDGELVTRQPIKSPLQQGTGSSVARYNVGRSSGWVSFPGLVDEVRYSTVARYNGDYLPQARFESDADTAVLLHFDEGSGETVQDSSANDYVATVAGAKWVRVGAPAGSSATTDEPALEFDGAGSYVEVPRLPLDLTKAYTVEFWTTHEPTLGGITAAFRQGDRGFRFWRIGTPHQIGVTARLGGSDASPVLWMGSDTFKPNPGEETRPQHLALVFDPVEQKFRFFRDGKRINIGLSTSAQAANADDNGLFTIGGYFSGGKLAGALKGRVHELCISQSVRYTADFTPAWHLPSDAETMALYRFDEGAGDVLHDASGHGHDGKIVGAKWVKIAAAAAASSTPSSTGVKALKFAGNADSLVEVPNIAWGRLDTFTMEAWVRSDETAPGRGFVIDRYKAASINRYEGRWQFTVKKKGIEIPVYASQPNVRPPGRWEHLAGVVQNKTMTFYVDGRRMATTPLPDELEDAEGGRLMFGRGLLGTIRQVRFSKSARYAENFAPAETFAADAETLALYRFDEGSGNLLRDSSGHNLHGAIKGATWTSLDDGVPAAMPGANAAAQAPTEAPFAGGDLAGWIGDPSIWKIENGELVGRLPDSGEVYLAGRKNYRDVEAAFDVKLVGPVNSGLQFRSNVVSETPADISGPQAEIGAGGKTGYAGLWWQAPARQTGRVVQPVATAVFEPLLKADDYNRMTVRCVGKHVTITLNGTTTIDGDFADIPEEGVLGWQLVSRNGPAEVRFRNFEVRDLSAAAATSSIAPAGAPGEFAPFAATDFALAFNGKDSDVTVPSWKYQGEHPLTVEAWAWCDPAAHRRQVQFIAGDPQMAGFAINNNPDGRRNAPSFGWAFMVGTGDGDAYQFVKAEPDPPPGRVTHFAGVYDGRGEVRFYVDGKLQGRAPAPGRFRPSSVPFAIGANFDGPEVANDIFAGRVYELRVSKSARYDGDFTPQARYAPDTDTIALYHFDAGAGDELRDHSGNNHHGKIYQARWVRADGTPAPGQEPASKIPVYPAAIAGGDNALAFNAETCGLMVPRLHYDGSHPLTIEAWTQPEQGPRPLRALMSRQLAMHPMLQLRFNPKTYQWELESQSQATRYYHSEAIADREAAGLVHVAAVLKDDQLRFFIDGKLRLVEPLDAPLLMESATSPFQIAQGPQREPSDYRGVIDEVRFSRTARYTEDFTPERRFAPDADTMALYHFDEHEGDVAVDASGNGYDLRLTDQPSTGRAPQHCAAPAVRPADPSYVPEVTRHGDAVEKEFGGHRYLLVRGSATWTKADAAARARGGHLVSISSAEENQFLKDVLLADHPPERIVWTGGTRENTQSAWGWSSGEPWIYADWREKEGNDGNAMAMANSRPLDGSAGWVKGWGDWDRNNPPMALSGPIQGRTRAWGYVIEWDTLDRAAVKGPPIKIVAAPSPVTYPQEDSSVDLLAAVQIPRDVRSGDWRMDGGVLVTAVKLPDQPQSVLYLSPEQKVPEQYDLELVVEREQAGGTGMVVGIVAGGAHQATVMMDSYGVPNRWGLENIDGKYLSNGNPTNTPGSRLPPGKKKTVRIEVRRTGVRVLVDAEQVFAWQGRPDQLSTAFWKVEKPQSLFLGSQGRFRIHKIALTPR